LFLLSCSCAHRALHSFPTRRSSDLVFALGAGLEHGQAFAKAVLDALVVAGLEMQARGRAGVASAPVAAVQAVAAAQAEGTGHRRSEEHTSELQSRENLVCRLQLEKK